MGGALQVHVLRPLASVSLPPLRETLWMGKRPVLLLLLLLPPLMRVAVLLIMVRAFLFP